MSFRDPPTLQSIAAQSLVKDEDLAISSLQGLTRVFFPPLFKAAFTGRHTRILKAIVAAWPFPCLSVGALMNSPDIMILQAVLDGVDMHLTGNVHQRRQKLQVLDLRNVHHDLWGDSAGPVDGDCVAQTVCERQIATRPHRYALRQRLRVVTNLRLEFDLKRHQTYFLQWAQERRGSLHLCCVKMHIRRLSMHKVRKVLKIFQPECIEEFKLDADWNLSTLARFAPCLGQMRNLRKLILVLVLNTIFRLLIRPTVTQDRRVTKFISQFSKLNCLQYLQLAGFYFLIGHLNELFQCLKTPLEYLFISVCKFSQSDLESFAQCQSLHQLKHLHLQGIIFRDLSLVPLNIFLENVAETLKTLDFEHCRMTDSQLSTLLPGLNQCSQLSKVNFYDNDFSMTTLRNLIHHTANLSQLVLEFYPAPLECYEIGIHSVEAERFIHLSSELMDILCSVRQPQSVSFASFLCVQCLKRCTYNPEIKLCHCWQ